MANITTCTRCSQAYEAGSEEQANEPVRLCFGCREAERRYQDAVTGADQRATQRLVEGLRRSQ